MKNINQNASLYTGVAHYMIYLILIICLILSAPSPLDFNAKRGNSPVTLKGCGGLVEVMQQKGATYEMVLQSKAAMNISLHNLPKDLSRLSAKQRVPLFISLILSHAIKSNNEILSDRKNLIRYTWDLENNKPITEARKKWYEKLAKKYHATDSTPDQLLDRVDIIPVSLTIAQAIIESGWGTSRFAREGNALYGQHLSRNSAGKYITSLYGGVKVAAFDSLLDATRSYMLNLNSSRPYTHLRKIRSKQRSQGQYPTGYELAHGLRHYSEIGYGYVEDIRHIINKYKLSQLEETRLQRHYPELAVYFQPQ